MVKKAALKTAGISMAGFQPRAQVLTVKHPGQPPRRPCRKPCANQGGPLLAWAA